MTVKEVSNIREFDKAVADRDVKTIRGLIESGVCTDEIRNRGLTSATKLGYRDVLDVLLNAGPVSTAKIVELLGIASNDMDIELVAYLREALNKAMVAR